MNACYYYLLHILWARYKLTFIVDGIDDMHRNGRNAAMPLRLLHMDADVAVLITRREATANMARLSMDYSFVGTTLAKNEHNKQHKRRQLGGLVGRWRDIRDDVSIKRYRVGSDKFNFHVKSQVGFKRTSS